MSCRTIVMKEVDAYLAGKSDIVTLDLFIKKNCPDLKERREVLKEAKKKIFEDLFKEK